MKLKGIETYNRKSVFCLLKDHCHLSKEYDFMEVTEWKNGEGFDVTISDPCGNRVVEMTNGEIELLMKIYKNFDKLESK